MKRVKRILRMWFSGRMPLCKKMKEWEMHRRFYFSWYNEYPKTMADVNEFYRRRRLINAVFDQIH